MMDTKARERLLERLKSATGPDRELDRDLGAFFGLGPGDDGNFEPWPYTTSADAALALLTRTFEAPTTAISIMIALLTALRAQQEEGR